MRDALMQAFTLAEPIPNMNVREQYHLGIEAFNRLIASAQSDRTLPELPEGWRIIQLQDDRPQYDTWQAVISNSKCTIADYGPTPRAAVLAALEKING